MSGTQDYYLWATEKYGFDENGEPVVDSFDLVWEFFADHLDETVRMSTGELRYDLFVSYAWADHDEPASLVRALSQKGLRVWFDRVTVGMSDKPFLVYRLLHQGIANSRAGLAYVTPAFLQREWTVHEVQGMVRHKRHTMLILDGVDESSTLTRLDIDDSKVTSYLRPQLSLEQLAETVTAQI